MLPVQLGQPSIGVDVYYDAIYAQSGSNKWFELPNGRWCKELDIDPIEKEKIDEILRKSGMPLSLEGVTANHLAGRMEQRLVVVISPLLYKTKILPHLNIQVKMSSDSSAG